MARTVTFKGTPLTLVGRNPGTGSYAPDFSVVSQDLKEVRLVDFKGKIKVINTFPSLDTPVCDLQVKEFNRRSHDMSADVVVIGISKDLPFAQKRFCSANEITHETVLSDYKASSFGINYGLLIRELNLLARAVVIIDKGDVLRYAQVAGELTSAVDFAAAAGNLDAVLRSPALSLADAGPRRCAACEGKVTALSGGALRKALDARPGWECGDGKKIVKEFRFGDFSAAGYFVDIVSLIAEEQGHHPTLVLSYGKARVTLTTHAAGGLTDNDFIMAGIIDEIET